MTSDVASLPREPDILIGMITELRDGAGAGAASPGAGWSADSRAAGPCRGAQVRVPPAVALPHADAGGSGHCSRPLYPNALERARGVVAEAATHAAAGVRDVGN